MTLSGDAFFVDQEFPFFATISDHIKFSAAKRVPNRRITQLVQASKHVQAVCSSRGFRIKCALMDGEFVPVKHKLASAGVILNATSANKHAPKTERQIRVTKERVLANRHTSPFKLIPLTALIKLTCSSVSWIDAFPPEGGVSSALSPRETMTSIQFDCNKHCKSFNLEATSRCIKSLTRLTLRQLAQSEPSVLAQLEMSKVPASSST